MMSDSFYVFQCLLLCDGHAKKKNVVLSPSLVRIVLKYYKMYNSQALLIGGHGSNSSGKGGYRCIFIDTRFNITRFNMHDERSRDQLLDRSLHASARRKDGSIIVCGGLDELTTLKSCVIIRYVECMLDISMAADMCMPRAFHSVSTLNNGRVLACGGYTDPSDDTSSCEVYDWLRNEWLQIGPLLPRALSEHSATVLANGDVLVIGGQSRGIVFSECVLIKVETMTLKVRVVASMGQARKGHASVLLPSGRVFVAGGSFFPDDRMDAQSLSSCESYCPYEDKWYAEPPMIHARSRHAMAVIADKIVVIGGRPYDTVKNESFSLETQRWTELPKELQFMNVQGSTLELVPKFSNAK